MISELLIVEHPVSVCVPPQYTTTLSVRAVGPGTLQYQWFQSNQSEVPGATSADFVVQARGSQQYACRVNNQQKCVFSRWVKVKVMESGTLSLPGGWSGEPHITENPNPQRLSVGGTARLCCRAFGIPAPCYQWYRNGNVLQGKTRGILKIEDVNRGSEGSYLCAVSNALGEQWTEPVDVCIALPGKPTAKTLSATDKVALLIGNLNYSHVSPLLAPMLDVYELYSLLQQLGFRVVSLLDLSKAEMLAAIGRFLQLLSRGAYALFYYAGHGYECSGRNYLVPTDAPRPYRPEDCVSVQRVMHGMQERHTALNVVLLDTCRKWYNLHCVASLIRSLAPLGNTVYGYATCEDAEAFEVQDGERSSSIFTKYLNRHILRAEKVTRVLELVSEDLGRDPLVAGKQVMEIRHTLKDPRALTDPIRTSGHTQELQIRDLCWILANELPRCQLLTFACGVTVQLSFSALFSNVVVVFAKVKAVGPGIVDCTIRLKTSPVMGDIFPSRHGSDSLDRMGSLWFGSNDRPACSLRFCGLQKLQEPLVITVDLHYTDSQQRLRLSESLKLDVGLPLVALWGQGHLKKKAEGTSRRQDTPRHHVDHDAPPRQPSNPPAVHCDHPSTQVSLKTCKGVARHHPGHLMDKHNEPEEVDENDFLEHFGKKCAS
ncbi:mucosa-associated lymphoid tissue lymphoma translocation protein 1-like [Paramormyrops kingsleyae]|uniref:mucosa-associated lymphoid tissue lymphoma translocation protein 1-like n=1 Tax=Paramormyrops kingsleyae TaxID=1676925 RepID=UPI003B978327